MSDANCLESEWPKSDAAYQKPACGRARSRLQNQRSDRDFPKSDLICLKLPGFQIPHDNVKSTMAYGAGSCQKKPGRRIGGKHAPDGLKITPVSTRSITSPKIQPQPQSPCRLHSSQEWQWHPVPGSLPTSVSFWFSILSHGTDLRPFYC